MYSFHYLESVECLSFIRSLIPSWVEFEIEYSKCQYKTNVNKEINSPISDIVLFKKKISSVYLIEFNC